MTPTEKYIVSSCNSGCLLIISYGRAQAWGNYLSHLLNKNPEINSHQHAVPYDSWHILKKNIMSSCNLRCVLIFPYGRARAWCGYLSHLLDKNPRDQFHQNAAQSDSWHIYPRKDIASSCNLRCLLIFPYGCSRTYQIAIACMRAGWFRIRITCITCTFDCNMWAYATHEVKSIIYLFIYLFYSLLFRNTDHWTHIWPQRWCSGIISDSKPMLHKFFLLLWVKEWALTFTEAAILNFTQDGRRKSTTTCLRWFLKPLCSYLTPCQI